MKHDLRRQLKAVLTSDLTSEAMVIWTYLAHVIPQGAGQPHLDKVFGPTDVGWRDAIDILLELELVEQAELARGGLVYRAKAPDEVAGKMTDTEVPTLEGALAALEERYQIWREDNGFRRWTATPSDQRKWTALLQWMRTHKVSFREFCDFALALYKPITGVTVPGPAHLAGPYAQSNWLNRDSSGPVAAAASKAKAHAGSDYRPAKAIKRKLKSSGVDISDMDAAQCRYVDDLAQALALDPDMAVPAKWQEAVNALTEDHATPA